MFQNMLYFFSLKNNISVVQTFALLNTVNQNDLKNIVLDFVLSLSQK